MCFLDLFVVCFVKGRTFTSQRPLSKAKRNMSEKHDLLDSFWSFVTVFGRTEPQNFSRFDFNPQIVQIRWWAVES